MNEDEKNRRYLTGWEHILNLVWGNKYRAQSWLGTWGLADWIHSTFLVKWSIYRDMPVLVC